MPQDQHISRWRSGSATNPANALRTLRTLCTLCLLVAVHAGLIAPIIAAPESAKHNDRSEHWQAAFAERKQWWSLQPVKEVEPPTVKNKTWPLGPVDHFILAQLEARGLQPASPADKQTWLRRTTFALTGLPPTAEEIASFLADESPTARRAEVDRLLASPQFGERWARHWMDLVRFAESYGHEQDYTIHHAWQYRDYLIRAFNTDVPYDQFVIEHIAGDLLESPRRHPIEGYNESVIATGFWYLHQATHAPVDTVQDESDRIENQIDVFSKTFLGLTVACARCHDHKFDAISSEDYYSLAAYLRSSRQQFAFLDPGETIGRAREELQTLHTQTSSQIEDALTRIEKNGGPPVAPYLIAAHAVLHGPRETTNDVNPGRTEFVYDDFEDGTYTNRWRLEGEAFGTKPASGRHPNQQPVAGFLGKGLVNSFTRGDKPTGRLRSQQFVIQHRYIRFLLGGGGGAKSKARFVLRIGDQEVRKASGPNNERLIPHVWDIDEFHGREATLEIIDHDETIWGHINVDHIVFTDSPYPVPIVRTVENVASARGLDEARLHRWLTELTSPQIVKSTHPLHPWATALVNNDLETAGDESTRALGVDPDTSGTAPAPDSETSTSTNTVEFTAGGFSGWYPSGHAFGQRRTATGKWRVSGDQVELLASNGTHSGLWSEKLQGVLRSPTFVIPHDNIHFRVAGRAGQVRLIVRRYALREFNPLLFGETMFDVNTDGRYVWHSLTRDIRRHKGQQAYIEIIDDGDGYVAVDRIVFSTNPKPPTQDATQAERIAGTGTLAELAEHLQLRAADALRAWNRGARDPEGAAFLAWLSRKDLLDWGKATEDIQRIVAKSRDIEKNLPKPIRVLAMTDGTVEETHLLKRGDPRSPGHVVARRPPEVFSERAVTGTASNGSRRRELAETLVTSNKRLIARVMVNRVWQHLFGRGLVASVDNFGVLGQSPSHPALLDYLATEFQHNSWSIKQLIRSLVLTRTYEMTSAKTDLEIEAADPDNTLLHRMRVTRLEGEAIRDSILAVAGTLNPKMFGPSVPAYLSPYMGNHRRPPNSGPMDGDRRRSLYLEVRRNFLSPMMLAFDMPLPDTTRGKRSASNVPAQALTLMNDELVVSQANAWAERSLKEDAMTVEERMRELFLRALGRAPEPAEMQRMISFLKDQALTYGLSEEAALKDGRIWADACHVMFMLKEFIYVQ